MPNEITLSLYDCFTDGERQGLTEVVGQRGLNVVFLHHQESGREYGYLYRGDPQGRPDWLVSRDGPKWLLWDVLGQSLVRADDPAEMINALAFADPSGTRH